MSGNSDFHAHLESGWQAFGDVPRNTDVRGNPVISVGDPLPQQTAEAIYMLAEKNGGTWPLLFMRGGRIVRVGDDERGNPVIDECKLDHLRWVLSRVARFVRYTEKDEKLVPPPLDVVRDFMATPALPLPPLTGLTEMPVLREDGSLVDQPGYDRQTGMLYVPPDDLVEHRFPSKPTAEDAYNSVAWLLNREGLLGDFPFESEADQANLLALMLTPILRPAVNCPAPLCLVDAPTQGTGKGLLTDVVSTVTLGRVADKQPLDGAESEIRKMLMGILVSGTPFVVFDNVDEVIQSSALEGLLTADSWADRILGETRIIRAENRVTWAATGNNLHVGGTMARRCYHVRLNAKMERPWTRTGFTHPNLLMWAKEHRVLLVTALLAMARWWYVNGCPPASGVPQMGSFQPWADTVGGVLQACGVRGFLGNVEQMYEQLDVGAQGWAAFFVKLHEAFGNRIFTAADVKEHLIYMADSLPDELDVMSSTRTIGRVLMSKLEQPYGDQGLMLVPAGVSHSTRRYALTTTSDLGVL